MTHEPDDLDEPDEAPALKAAFERPRQFVRSGVLIYIDNVERDLPGWGHVVGIIDNGTRLPLVICDTPQRANIIQLALQRLADEDPTLLAVLAQNAC